MLEFWKGDRGILRKASLIYDPTVTVEELRIQIEEQSRSIGGETEQGGEHQPVQGEFRLESGHEDGHGS